MSTYQEVQDRINNEYLNRGTFITETKSAIRAAIRQYETKRWTFNQTAVALATSAGVGYVAFPSNFLILDKLQITINSVDCKLNRRSRDWITEFNATRSQATPTDYGIYQNRINLSAIPDAVYALPMHYIKRLSVLSAADDTNAWIDGGMQDVIAYHAAKVVWGVSLRNREEAEKFAILERDALMEVRGYNEQFGSGKLEPTSF